MSRLLKESLGCTVVGVELFPEPAEQARGHCQRVIVGDAETMDFAAAFGEDRFDAVLFADVLEHLRDPAAVLRRVAPFLKDGGSVIASIPNIAHGSVRLALLAGEFRYRPTGLLDSTHLRFFTRETVCDLFEGAGFLITRWLRTRVPINDSEIGLPARAAPAEVVKYIAEDPEATTYQFVVRAVRSDQAGQVAALRAEIREARAANQWLVRSAEASNEIMSLVREGESVILADLGQLEGIAPGRRVIPFIEREGQYFGPPSDDAEAIAELERLRGDGAKFLAIAWPAFWWLEHYADFVRHLRERYRCAMENDRLVVFELRERR
jgi:hypothetical protein